MIYKLVFSLFLSLLIALFLYHKEKKAKKLIFLRTLSLFFLFLFLQNFSIKVKERTEIKPMLFLESNLEAEFSERVKDLDFNVVKIDNEDDLINSLKNISNSEIFYLGKFDYERKREILNLLSKNNIKFNYFYSEKFQGKDFKINPPYLIRKENKEGFLIEGKNIKLDIFENNIKKKSIRVDGNYLYTPEFRPNTTRKITFTSNDIEENLYVTDLDLDTKIKITSSQYHPIVGFLNRFFKNHLNANIEIEISGKIYNKLEGEPDFYVSIFKELNEDIKSILVFSPDTVLEGEFELESNKELGVDKIEIRRNLEGDTVLSFYCNKKKFPIVLKHRERILLTTPDLWKINLATDGDFEKLLIEVIRENFLPSLNPKIVPLFSNIEREGEFKLSFLIKKFGEISDLIEFKLNEKRFFLKKVADNIYESSPIKFNEGKYKINIFNKSFDLIVAEREVRKRYYDISLLETAREITGGEKINLEDNLYEKLKRKNLEKIGEKEIFLLESPFFLFIFIALYSLEIYLRKRGGLL
ncbi:MAG: hypothetical protein ABDH49_01780 [Candidatus Hydrothermales bacterium]